MLNKQGLFNRGNQSNAGRPPANTPINALNAINKTNPASTSPGHLAAMESATKPGSSVTESKPLTSTAPKEPGGSRLIVGPDVKLKGAEIQDCDTLVVEGRVEATMDSRVIQITEHGAFSGKVGIDVAEVHGNFDGELTARSQLIIHSSGRVSGKIRYGKIYIEEGGELSGDIAAITDNDKGHNAKKDY
jgi:cytoskeletal protein CcmA (bactofilin family)